MSEFEKSSLWKLIRIPAMDEVNMEVCTIFQVWGIDVNNYLTLVVNDLMSWKKSGHPAVFIEMEHWTVPDADIDDMAPRDTEDNTQTKDLFELDDGIISEFPQGWQPSCSGKLVEEWYSTHGRMELR